MIENINQKLKELFLRSPYCFSFITVSIVCIFIMVLTTISTEGEAFSSILFMYPDNTFMDFYNIIFISHSDPYNNGGIYPPLTYSIFYIIGLYTLPYMTTPIYVNNYEIREIQTAEMSLALFLIIGVYLLYKGICIISKSEGIEKELLFISLLLSTSVILTIERANTVIYVLDLLILFIHFYRSDNEKLRLFASLCLALAVSIKIYAAVFLILLLAKKRTRDLAICMAFIIVANTVPFLFIGGNPVDYILNLFRWNDYMGNDFPSGMTIPQLLLVIGYPLDVSLTSTVVKIVLILIVIILRVTNNLGFNWKNVTIITITMILGGGNFGGCYQLFLIPAFIMFLNEEKTITAKNTVFAACFTLMFILIPNNFFNCGYYSLTTWLSVISTTVVYFMIIGEKIMEFKQKTHSASASVPPAEQTDGQS